MTDNPFPATAAESGRPVPPGAAVRTQVLDSALELFRAYLHHDAASRPLGQPGEVIAVTGEPGTGKTLVAGVLRGEAASAQPPAPSVYLRASAPAFAPILDEFAGQLRAERGLLRAAVRHLYAQLVADSLGEWEPVAPVVAELRAGRVADPVALVHRLGLMASDIDERLTERLLELTGQHEAMATVLGLLLRPGFDDAVWDWLRGRPPAEVLRDRLVTQAVTGDHGVLAAMGALVAVLCAAGTKLLIVLDELEVAFVDRDQVTDTFATPFRRFLSTAVEAGAFVLLAGLPSFVAALPDQVRERTGPLLETASFDHDQVAGLIATRSDVELPPPVLATVEDLTGSVPRSVLALCNRLVRAGGAGQIGEDTVREAARIYVEERNGRSFGDTLARILTAQRWEFQRDHYLGLPTDSRVDFWVDLGEEDRHVAILVAGNVIERDDLDALTKRVLTVQELRPDDDILIVVMGFLTSTAAEELTELAGTEPVLVRPGRTAADIETALRDIADRAADDDADPLARVDSRVRRVGRGQARTQAHSASVVRTVRKMGADQNSKLAAMAAEQSIALQAVVAKLDQLIPAGAEPATEADLLPPAAEAMLEEALNRLDVLLNGLNAVFADAFNAPTGSVGEERMMLRSRLRNNATDAAGAADFLRRLIIELRAAIRRWFASGAPDTALTDIVLTYNDALEHVRISDLTLLRQITARAGDREDPRVPGTWGPPEFPAALYFSELASRVQSVLSGPAAVRRR